MKKKIASLLAIIFLFVGLSAAWAEVSKDETRLESEASTIDKDAGKPKGETVVTQRLEKQFKVDESTITGLRDKKLGYGEITIVLAMADKLGGINATNIDKILAMRQGPPKEGWGEIAKKLGFKLGPVISSVEKVKKEANKDIGKTGREKTDRPERPERPEKGGR